MLWLIKPRLSAQVEEFALNAIDLVLCVRVIVAVVESAGWEN